MIYSQIKMPAEIAEVRALLRRTIEENPDLSEEACSKLFISILMKPENKRLAAAAVLSAFQTLEQNRFEGEDVTDDLKKAYLALIPAPLLERDDAT